MQRNASQQGSASNTTPVNGQTPDVEMKRVTITPELAQQWLDSNPDDRSVRDHHVAKLARDMERGEWKLNGDPIRFNPAGQRIDGQHRLHAVVKAGVTIDTFIAVNVPDDAHHTIDTGKARTLSDVLKYRKESNFAVLAATLRLYWHYLNGSLRGNTAEPAASECLDLLDANPGLRDSAAVAIALKKVSRQARICAVAHYLLTEVDAAEAAGFFERLQDGAKLEEDSGVLKLREWLITERSKNATPAYSLALYIKAWNSYITGNPVKTLRWQMGGSTPESFPKPVSPHDF